jgi:hypothetical protein
MRAEQQASKDSAKIYGVIVALTGCAVNGKICENEENILEMLFPLTFFHVLEP